MVAATRIALFLLAGFLVFLQGCATSGPLHLAEPSEVQADQSSLVIGSLGSRNLNGLIINGKKYEVTAGARNLGLASFAIELPPGKHTVDAVGDFDTNSFTQYPLGRTFETGPGDVVSLGSVVVTSLGDRKFASAWMENHDDVVNDLVPAAPGWLAERLEQGEYDAAPGAYGDQKLVDAILANEFSFGSGIAKKIPENQPLYFAGAPLGTIIAYIETSGGAQPVKVIHTNRTTDYYHPCNHRNGRLVCVVQDTIPLDGPEGAEEGQATQSLAFVDMDAGKVSTKPLPITGQSVRGVLLFGNRGIVLVGYDFSVHASVNNGKEWSSIATMVEAGFFQMDSGIRYDQGNGKLYLLLNGSSSGVVTVDKDSGQLASIVVPEEFDSLGGIAYSTSALFVGPEWTLASNSQLLVRRWGADQWLIRELPQGRCMAAWVDPSDQAIVVRCGGTSKTTYRSGDLGKTWH